MLKRTVSKESSNDADDSPWLCPGVGGGEKKGKRKRGGEKRRRGEKEKKLIVYRYMCLRVYLYAI